MVLLDVTPSAEMMEEGIAREVISKIQKLRKKVLTTCTYMYMFMCSGTSLLWTPPHCPLFRG